MDSNLLNTIALQAQEYYRHVPVIILGSGASAPFGMAGMGALANHLTADVSLQNCESGEIAAWETFKKNLMDGVDLETALHKVELTGKLTERVVRSTWEFLSPQDLKIFGKAMVDSDLFPLGRMIRHLFKSTRVQINIITPNYDRLAEYACEQEGFHHYTGFSHGYIRRTAPKDYLSCARQVNIWKVHGSLDWFIDERSRIVCTGNTQSIPAGLLPLIVTPGIAKYRSTHKEPYKSIIHEADNVLDSATSYLCVGFGFNDEHIQEKLVNKCESKDAAVIVVTYKLSESAKRFLFGGQVKNWLAIESGDHIGDSVIYSSKISGSTTISQDFWSLAGFLKLVM